jgi:probable phosphomutase (TIGR03848 family)
LVLLVRHGLTAGTGKVLTGRTPGIALDERGREQATALAARLAGVPLDAIVTSPLARCRQTADAIAAARDGGQPMTVSEEEDLAEVKYGDWTGKSLRRLAKEPLWRVVQTHPSAVRFPGEDGESMPDMQLRAVGAVRKWNAKLGKDAVYLICSHGDVIKAVIADSLGMHLDLCQRIQVDPCSLSMIRYTPLRPFLVRMNDTGGAVTGLARPVPAGAGQQAAPGDRPSEDGASGHGASGQGGSGNGASGNGTGPARAAVPGAVSRPRRGEGDAAIGGGAGG